MKSVILAVLTVGVAVLLPAPVQAAEPGCQDLEIVAHRGYHRGVGVRIDENTLTSFRAAAAREYTIETDVRPDAEGKLWIMHDRNVLRTTGVNGFIDMMSSRQVGQLRTKKTGEPIPSLAEAAATVADFPSTRVYLEIKSRAVTGQVVEIIRDAGIVDQAYATSHTELIRSTEPDINLVLRSLQDTPDPKTVADDGYDVVFLQESQITASTVAEYHAEGLEVQNRLANTTDKWQSVLAADADAILTDKPDDLRNYCAAI